MLIFYHRVKCDITTRILFSSYLKNFQVNGEEKLLKDKCKSVILSNRSKSNFDWKNDNKVLNKKNCDYSGAINFSPQEYQDYICIPLPFDSDINGKGGAWRVWSCILLAHLIKDAMKLPGVDPNLIEVVCDQSIVKISKSYSYGKLYKRGKYQTKCPKKYFWQKSLSEEEYEDDKTQSNKGLEFRQMLNTIS